MGNFCYGCSSNDKKKTFGLRIAAIGLEKVDLSADLMLGPNHVVHNVGTRRVAAAVAEPLAADVALDDRGRIMEPAVSASMIGQLGRLQRSRIPARVPR